RPSFQVHWAAVVDFSARGLGLLVDESVHVGAVLGLRLHLGPEDDQRVLLAAVRHCTLYTANAWLLGCVLRQPLDRNSLLAMVITGDPAIAFPLKRPGFPSPLAPPKRRPRISTSFRPGIGTESADSTLA